jgi:hypothetical protein
MAVGGGIHHGLGGDIAVRAGPVFGHEGLPQPLGKPLAGQARADVDAAARGEAGQDAHRPAGIAALRGSKLRSRR